MSNLSKARRKRSASGGSPCALSAETKVTLTLLSTRRQPVIDLDQACGCGSRAGLDAENLANCERRSIGGILRQGNYDPGNLVKGSGLPGPP
jgi:hypothetical protein